MDRTWQFLCGKTGAKYIRQPIPLPVTDEVEFAACVLTGLTNRSLAVFISHVTSPTALVFPVPEVCRRAREAGLISIVDGAHAPGQLPLDLSALGADIYAAVRLPQWVEPSMLQRRLYEQFRIEVPAYLWSNQPFLRLSFQAYNDSSDADALLEALASLLDR